MDLFILYATKLVWFIVVCLFMIYLLYICLMYLAGALLNKLSPFRKVLNDYHSLVYKRKLSNRQITEIKEFVQKTIKS